MRPRAKTTSTGEHGAAPAAGTPTGITRVAAVTEITTNTIEHNCLTRIRPWYRAASGPAT